MKDGFEYAHSKNVHKNCRYHICLVILTSSYKDNSLAESVDQSSGNEIDQIIWAQKTQIDYVVETSHAFCLVAHLWTDLKGSCNGEHKNSESVGAQVNHSKVVGTTLKLIRDWQPDC